MCNVFHRRSVVQQRLQSLTWKTCRALGDLAGIRCPTESHITFIDSHVCTCHTSAMLTQPLCREETLWDTRLWPHTGSRPRMLWSQLCSTKHSGSDVSCAGSCQTSALMSSGVWCFPCHCANLVDALRKSKEFPPQKKPSFEDFEKSSMCLRFIWKHTGCIFWVKSCVIYALVFLGNRSFERCRLSPHEWLWKAWKCLA